MRDERISYHEKMKPFLSGLPDHILSQIDVVERHTSSWLGHADPPGLYGTPDARLAGVVALLWRRPRGWATILVLWGAAAAVLGIHAASQGVAPEFALPLYPLFIVTALAALAGDRGPARRSSA